MSVKINESASIIAAVLVVGAILVNLDYSTFRKKTFLEKNYLKCLTGISSKDRQLLDGKFGIRSIYINWETPFPWNAANKIYDAGSLMMITWEPYLKKNREKSILADIAVGTYDELIENFAISAKKFAKPFFLRWGQEPNGNWYSWSGNVNESSLYIEAHRRIYEIFKKNECNNVKFVFSVNYKDTPDKRWNKFENYYPGTKYVDIIGLDVYNWGNIRWWSKWESPEKLIKKAYNRAIKLDKTKPIILSEVASCSSGGNKSLWVEEFIDVLKNKFTAVKAFVWFDWKKECNWQITDNGKIFDIYKNKTADGFFSNDWRNFNEVFAI